MESVATPAVQHYSAPPGLCGVNWAEAGFLAMRTVRLGSETAAG